MHIHAHVKLYIDPAVMPRAESPTNLVAALYSVTTSTPYNNPSRVRPDRCKGVTKHI